MKKHQEIETEESNMEDIEGEEISLNRNVSTHTLQRLNTKKMKKKEPRDNTYPLPNIQRSFDDNLRNCIQTEKGLLRQDDFEHVMKVIEVYSKVLLFEVR